MKTITKPLWTFNRLLWLHCPNLARLIFAISSGVFFSERDEMDTNCTINKVKKGKKKKRKRWHIVPAVHQVARAHVSKLTAECFVLSLSILHSVLKMRTERQQSDEHQHLDCQLKGPLTFSRLANYTLYMSIYIYIVYVCLSTVCIYSQR